MTGSPAGGASLATGDYFGRPTRRLEGGGLWLEFLAEGGPRIVRLGLAGRADNLFSETPGIGWDTPDGRYELLGGHRLWYAPETLSPWMPDAGGLEIVPISGGVNLRGRLEPGTGLRREMEVRVDPAAPAVTIRHRISNESGPPIELAPWPITQLRVGGTALIPQPAAVHAHAIVPNRLVALWPYSSWTDERLRLGDGLTTFEAKPGDNFKLGCLSPTGTGGYLRDGVLFVKRFPPAAGAARPDMGCNLELYCDNGSFELESIGPLVRLEPGSAVTQDERWELHDVGGRAIDPASLAALVVEFGLDRADPMPVS